MPWTACSFALSGKRGAAEKKHYIGTMLLSTPENSYHFHGAFAINTALSLCLLLLTDST